MSRHMSRHIHAHVYTHICTQALDMLLGGGAAMQQVLEIGPMMHRIGSSGILDLIAGWIAAGKPGAGKTAIAMQLAVNVQLPPSLTGVAGEALYLGDRQPSISMRRRC